MRFLIVDDSSTMRRMIINTSIAAHPGRSRSHDRSTRRGIRPQSTVHSPQSTVHSPQSTVHGPRSTVDSHPGLRS
jgi:hypothetical protein